MGIKDVLKVSRKTFINPRAWIGYDNIKAQTKTIVELASDVLVVPTPKRTETFTEALNRLKIKPENVKNIQATYLTYAYLFLSLAITDVVYGFYLLIAHTFLGFVMAIAVGVLLLAQAFKYHFWYFELKSKKLGCSFLEWRKAVFRKRGKG